MSSFITAKETKSRVAKLVYRELFCNGDAEHSKLIHDTEILNNITTLFNKLTNKTLTIENGDVEIFKILEDMNSTAVKYLYKREGETLHDEMPITLLADTYTTQTFKSLECFIYNSIESDFNEDYKQILDFLKLLTDKLAKYLVWNTQLYKMSVWG